MNARHSSPTTSTIKVTEVNSTEQARRIDQAIARRAYELFEQRGGMGWHELEDWRQAESEIRSKLCFGRTSSDGSLVIACDIARFKDGSVEIWAAPRQITICGKPTLYKQPPTKPNPYCGPVFRAVPLAVAIEPARITANRRRHFLEIHLPIVQSHQEGRVRAHAA